MNETLKETVKEVVSNFTKASDLVTEPARQRMGHPFIGSFAISWILFNWKSITYFIMTSSKVEDRIKYIDENFYHWNNLFAYPLLAAVFYTLILGWFDAFSDLFNKIPTILKSRSVADKKIESIKNDIRIITEQKKLENAKAENKELEELNNKIELLTKELDIKEEQNAGLHQDLFRSLDELKLLEKENNDFKNSLVDLSIKLDNLKNENRESKKELFSIIKEIIPPNQFNRVIEIMQRTTSDFFTDNDLSESLADIKNESRELVYFRTPVGKDITEIELDRIKKDLKDLNKYLKASLIYSENEIFQIKVVGPEIFGDVISQKEIENIILKHTIGTL